MLRKSVATLVTAVIVVAGISVASPAAARPNGETWCGVIVLEHERIGYLSQNLDCRKALKLMSKTRLRLQDREGQVTINGFRCRIRNYSGAPNNHSGTCEKSGKRSLWEVFP